MSIKIGFVSLGCPKNQVDAELMLNKLTSKGYEITDVVYEADVVIINTCGFIEDAKKESIDNILEVAEMKKDGGVKKIIVTGCLAERYKYEIKKEIPEVDGVAGLGANGDIAEIVDKIVNGEDIETFPNKENLPLTGDRLLTTPDYWAYLKIADGCSNHCSYCAIPLIRGEFRSRPLEDVVSEAETLAKKGVKELIVIAQDTTRYGLDLYGGLTLPKLLKALENIEGVRWIRLLYCYPDRITDELIDTIKNSKKILHYMDIPLQHADERILKMMNRTGDYESLSRLILKLREEIPDIILRTTFIAGFPGEDEDAFNALSKFVDDMAFDRMGCFSYSPEEGTKAYLMEDQVPDDVKKERTEIINEQQRDIFINKQKQYIGTVQKCIVEGYDAYTDSYFGRTWMDAPEIDSVIYFTGKGDYDEGDIVDVEIFDTNEYDFMGEIV